MVRLWHHLSRSRKRQFALLLGLMLVSTLSEVVSLGAVLPFLGILTAPDRVFNHPLVADMARAWGLTSADQLVLPFTVAFATAALAAGAIRMLLLWASTRVAFASGADLGFEVYRRTLYQPYHVHAARNSSEVISGITKKVDGVVFYVLVPLLTLLSSSVLLVAITLVLIAIDPLVALVAAVGFGVSYGLIALVSRRRLRRSSQRIAHEQRSPLIGHPAAVAFAQTQDIVHPAQGTRAVGSAQGEDALHALLRPVEAALQDLATISVGQNDAARLLRGQAVLIRGRDAPIGTGPTYATCKGQLIAVGQIDKGELRPLRVFNFSNAS